MDFKLRHVSRGSGDVVELHPAYEEIRLSHRVFSAIRSPTLMPSIPLTGELLKNEEQKLFIYPAVHYVMPEDKLAGAGGWNRSRMNWNFA